MIINKLLAYLMEQQLDVFYLADKRTDDQNTVYSFGIMCQVDLWMMCRMQILSSILC